jgi:hypothetical protein
VTAAVLLRRLAELGVSAAVDRGALRLRPASQIPTDLLAELRDHKTDLLALLEAGVSVALPALLPPVPPPISEFRARLWLAAADPTRAGDICAARPPSSRQPPPRLSTMTSRQPRCRGPTIWSISWRQSSPGLPHGSG